MDVETISREELPPSRLQRRFLSEEQFAAILATVDNGTAVIISDFKGADIAKASGIIRQFLRFHGWKPKIRRVNGKLAVWVEKRTT